jgi:glycosyltransferase involved in cell wall biosynthesis
VKASILIAADNGATATMRCLEAIATTLPESIPFEVILVDDATTDATADALAGVGGDFRVLRNETARGSDAAWGQAASLARGEFLVLLRHDGTVRPGCLQALLAALEHDTELQAARPRVIGGPAADACLALRTGLLGGCAPAALEPTLARARAAAVEIPAAAIEIAAPAPALRDIGGLGTFFATRLAGTCGEVLYCSTAERAAADLRRSTAIALVTGEISPADRAEIERTSGLLGTLDGYTATSDGAKSVPLSILDRWATPGPTPERFRALAVVTAYNERDVIVQTVGRLLAEGMEVHLLDNWSTDDTLELVESAHGDRVTLERFPAEGPSATYDWIAILDRVEAVTRERRCDWAIHQDADEIRESPWPGVSLRDALYRVHTAGFNCVDHTVLNFRPTDDTFTDGADLGESFGWCEFPAHQSDFMQLKAWSAPGAGVGLSVDGGHQVRFPGRRIFPYKFLLRHYPIRSQRHGERKVLRDRRTRWNRAERARGWHVHYDGYNESSSFIWKPDGLLRFDDPAFMADHLVERISGVGLSAEQIWAHAQIQAALAA